MLLHTSPGLFTRWQALDAREREFHLCHIPGHETLSIGLVDARLRHLDLDRRLAAQLVSLLEPFARTGQLPGHESPGGHDWCI